RLPAIRGHGGGDDVRPVGAGYPWGFGTARRGWAGSSCDRRDRDGRRSERIEPRPDSPKGAYGDFSWRVSMSGSEIKRRSLLVVAHARHSPRIFNSRRSINSSSPVPYDGIS